jgi:mono/diheme cytochrome c family protein
MIIYQIFDWILFGGVKMKNLNLIKKIQYTLLLISISLISINCGEGKESANDSNPTVSTDPQKNKGIGPIKSIPLESNIDEKRASEGEKVFEAKCSACHKFDERVVGPALKGVTQRRSPEWIMNMILNPQEMTQKDPIAYELLSEYLTQMVYQNVSEDETRSLLEFFRKMDKL